MKTALSHFVVTCSCVVRVLTQDYSLDGFTIDVGGGTSSGGVYSITGAVAPSDTSEPMIGGDFSLLGGPSIGTVEILETGTAPMLTIFRKDQLITISWSSDFLGFTLQQSLEANPATWVNVDEPVSDNGTIKFVTIKPLARTRFYRLLKQ